MVDLPDGFVVQMHDDVAVLTIQAGKANAMTPEFVADLIDAMSALAEEPPGALVITGSGRALSAGLALPRLVEYDRDAMRSFMRLFAQAMESVLAFPTPTVAAINGHAIAGGCVLALMCDYRVMVDEGGKIGLNEVALGIGLPAVVIEPLRARVPARSLAPIALSAQLFTAEDALVLDLVDDVVPASDLESAAIEQARSLTGAPMASAQVKAALLRPLITELRRHENPELESWLDTWFSPDAQRIVGGLVASLDASGHHRDH